jgi:soluble cytochrome b562
VKDFEDMPRDQRSEYVVSFLEKMTYDIGQKNPKLAHDIEDYFVKVPSGKEFPEGLERICVELAAVDSLADKGKADLSKIQIESIVVYIVKQKFPPPQRQETAK